MRGRAECAAHTARSSVPGSLPRACWRSVKSPGPALGRASNRPTGDRLQRPAECAAHTASSGRPANRLGPFVSFYASPSEGLQPSARHETAAAEQPPPARHPAVHGPATASDPGRALRALPPRADLLSGSPRVATQRPLRTHRSRTRASQCPVESVLDLLVRRGTFNIAIRMGP